MATFFLFTGKIVPLRSSQMMPESDWRFRWFSIGLLCLPAWGLDCRNGYISPQTVTSSAQLTAVLSSWASTWCTGVIDLAPSQGCQTVYKLSKPIRLYSSNSRLLIRGIPFGDGNGEEEEDDASGRRSRTQLPNPPWNLNQTSYQGPAASPGRCMPILLAPDGGPHAHVSHGATLVVQDLVLAGGRAESCGGSIYCTFSSTVIISGCIFARNAQIKRLEGPARRMNDYVYGGGAVCVDAGATAEVYRTIFVDNACTGKGGAIKLKGM